MKSVFTTLNRSSYAKNISLNILASLATRFIKPVFSILVARILVPADFGVMAIAMAIMMFFITVKDMGLTSVIVVKRDGYDYTRIHFTLQFLIAILGYLVIWLTKDQLAEFFSEPALSTIMPIIGIGLFINSIEDALLTQHYKKNEYKTVLYRQIIPSMVGGLSALILALLGYGVYALIWSVLIGSAASAIFLVVFNRWIPKFEIDFNRYRSLFKLGGHVTLQRLSGFIALQFDSLIIAKNLGAQATGIYRMSMDLSRLIPNTFLSQYQQVLFTETAAKSKDNDYLSYRYNQFIKTSFVFTSINFLVVYIFAPFLVQLILGNKWAALVEPIQLLSVSVISSFLVNPNGQFSQIFGFNYVYTYFSVVRSSVTAITVLIASFYSLHAALLCWVGVGIVGNFANFTIFKLKQDKISVTSYIYMMFIVVLTLYTLIVLDWCARGIV